MFVSLGPEAENEWWSKEKVEEKRGNHSHLVRLAYFSVLLRFIFFFLCYYGPEDEGSFLSGFHSHGSCLWSISDPLLIQSHKASQHPCERSQYH